MNRNKLINLTVILTVLVIASCGPSPEAAATQTAAAWTPTPEPTLTPTPLPFNLTLSLQDEGGNPVSFAADVEPEGGTRVTFDKDGTAKLTNLPGADVSLTITAQGYQTLVESVQLQPGENTYSAALAADPLQVLPAVACEDAGEVLYIEDFEDGEAKGWKGMEAPEWEFVEFENRGMVVSQSIENTEIIRAEYTRDYDFENFVWKMDLVNTGDIILNTHFQVGENEFYLIRLNPTDNAVQIYHFKQGKHLSSAERSYRAHSEWSQVAIAFFDGSLSFWLDGDERLVLDDPAPLKKGGLAIQANPVGGQVMIDNIVVCKLEGPYQPPAPEASE